MSMLLNATQSCHVFHRGVVFDLKDPGLAIRTIWSFQGSNSFIFMSEIFTECCSSCFGLVSPRTQKSEHYQSSSLLGMWFHAIP